MGAIKYNIGDKVLIKDIDWYNKNKNKHGDVLVEYKLFSHGVYTREHALFTKNMAKYCGQILTISEYSTMGYKMQECIDSGEDFDIWTDEMIEKLTGEENQKSELIPYFEEGTNKILYYKDKNTLECYFPMRTPEHICPEGYIFKDENGNVINAQKIVLEKKIKYPKTYDECCEVLGIGSYFEPEIRNATTEECHKFTKLIRLKRCRDAYWKLYGEEMGLSKPWEPDYTKERYIIHKWVDEILTGYRASGFGERFILEFPTEEICDEFKKNFDPDIEFCKEFL